MFISEVLSEIIMNWMSYTHMHLHIIMIPFIIYEYIIVNLFILPFM